MASVVAPLASEDEVDTGGVDANAVQLLAIRVRSYRSDPLRPAAQIVPT
jgi:hypothetical protein